MASRKEQKERLKTERLARQAAAARSERRRKLIGYAAATTLSAAMVAAVVIVVSAGGGDSGGSSALDADGFYTGPPPWPPEYDHLPQRLANVTFPPLGDESFHVHALLSVFVNGKPVTVPANVGFGPAVGEVPLHTHTADGLLHIEADEPYPFTLGEFLAVWGVRFSDTRLGPYENRGADKVQAFVDGKPLRDPVNHKIAEGENLVVGYGKPGSFPTRPDAGALEGS